MLSYAYNAFAANSSSTQRIASFRETGISARKASTVAWSTLILQSCPPYDAGAVNAWRGEVPETFGLLGWNRMR